MESPFFHGESDHEAADEEKNGTVDVYGCDEFPLKDTHQGIQDQRQQGGGLERDGIGDPPDRHEYGDGGHARDIGIFRVKIKK